MNADGSPRRFMLADLRATRRISSLRPPQRQRPKGLLDELHLFANPAAIGAGMPVFANLGAYQQLRLIAAQPFDCGITAVHLEPKRS